MEKEIILKRSLIGGFDRTQVIDCISSLQEKAANAESEAEALKALQDTIAGLERILSEKDSEIESLSASVAEAQEASRVSKASAQLMRESVDYADTYVESAKILARDISDKTNSKVEEAKEKIDSILLDITRLSEEILVLYKSLTDLKSEYDSFGDVCPPDSSDNYLAEDDETFVEEEAQAYSPSAERDNNSSPPKGDEDVLELLRRTKEKYQSMAQ